MNSRPGFSIRRLISQRRPRGAEDGCGDSVHEAFVRPSKDDLARPSSQHGQPARTWKRSKNPPQPIVVVSGSRAVHTITGPLPPLPDTPRSAASSLCSCDYRASPWTPASSTPPPLCYSRSKTPDTLSPLLSPRTAKLDEMGLLLQDTTDSSIPLVLAQTLSPVLDKTKCKDSQQNYTAGHQQAVEDMSENVRQLIRETDEAFKAVGAVLSEARLVSQQSSSPATSPHLARDSKFAMALAQSPRWPGYRAGPRSPLKLASPLTSPTRRSSVSKAKRRKSKKGRRGQQQQEQQENKRQHAATPKTGARWTLSENMSELLNGRLFHRLEADEIQTPDQVQEWRLKNRPSRPEVRTHTESIRTHTESIRTPTESIRTPTESIRTVEMDGSETPIEPFHLDDLPSRIGAAGVRMSMTPSPTVEVAISNTFDFGLDVARKDSTASEQQQSLPRLQEPTKAEEMLFRDISFPTPPQKNALRQQPRRQLPPLPTIPEVMVAGPDGTLKRDQQPQQLGIQSQAATVQQMQEMRQAKVTDEFVMLNCSPYTMTMPTFRHGPIRFARSELNVLDPKQLADETLDWTAFQMAILGGAGDFFSDSIDFTRMADADEVDEIAGWFDGLGVGSVGHLVSSEEEEKDYSHDAEIKVHHARHTNIGEQAQSEGEEDGGEDDDDDATERAGSVRERRSVPPALDTELASKCPPSPTGTAEYSPISSTGSSSASTQPEMVQIHRGPPPIPLVLERPPGLWNPKFELTGQGVGRWVLESSQLVHGPADADGLLRPGKGRVGSRESLPQSPMLDLVVGRSVTGEDYIVPMGFNLGHDLGDFLKWESENAYAAGFYG
ncbi:hypothetical protein RB601_006289 [Gaeumannomyces tritici]